MSHEDNCESLSDIRRWRRDREIELDDIAYSAPKEEQPTVEPCRPNPPLTTPAKLGNHFAQAAWKAGCEDEYQNAIDAKYGPGW
jgi:hypothetical protein